MTAAPMRRRKLAAGDVLFARATVGTSCTSSSAGRTATATALDATEVIEVQMDSARDFLARGPVWMRMLVDTLASRLIEADLGLAVANRRLGSPGAESD